MSENPENYDPAALTQALTAFLQAGTPEQAQQIIQEHPGLLTDEADAVLSSLLGAQNNEAAKRWVIARQNLLRRGREVGIPRAFAEMLPAAALAEAARQGLTPEEFLALLRASAQLPSEFANDLRHAQEADQHYLRTGDLTSLDTAAAAYRRILDAPVFASSSSLIRLIILHDAGGVFLGRYRARSRDDDLNLALACLRHAVAETPLRSANLHRHLDNLGNGLLVHFDRTGQLDDLDEAIRVLNRAVAETPPASPDLPAHLTLLGRGLRDRFARTGQLEDLNEIIRVCDRAVALTPLGSPELPGRLTNLGNGLWDRFCRTGGLEDLEEAIRALERAVAEAPAGLPGLPDRLKSLGHWLHERFGRTGRLEDLEEAIQIWERAVAETPSESPYLPSCLNNLGYGLGMRFARTGRPDDLEKAIRLLEQAVAATPPGSPDLPRTLTSLGNGLRYRFRLTGRLEDLEETIRVCERAVAETSPESPDLARPLNNLGNVLLDRFQRTGRREDLEEVIQLWERALAEVPAGSPDLSNHLANLGNGLWHRFGLMGQLEDLEEAIRLWERAVAETPTGSSDLPGHLTSLGNGLRYRFGLTGRLEDLEEAIKIGERAVVETPAGSPDLHISLNNLGIGLLARFGRTGQLEDLEEAIAVLEHAVAETPPGSPDLSNHLANLGTGLGYRFGRTGRREDLEEAIRVAKRAVVETPGGAPNLPGYLTNLGNRLRARFGRTRQLQDMEEAIGSYRRACELGTLTAPQTVLNAANNWGHWAVQRRHWAEAVEAFDPGLTSGRQLLGRQLRRVHKEGVLRDLQGLSGPAAYALAKLARFEDAVTTVERGRARLLAEALQRNRRDLERLPALGHADLYQRYCEIVATQERLTQPADAHADQPDYLSSQARLAAIVAANVAFDEVVTTIQKVPGYADFLTEPGFAEIRAVAQDAPLVYLLATSVGGLALIVNADGVQPVWLDDLTDAAVLEWLGGPADEPKLGGWRGAYQNWLVKPTRHAQEAWFTVVDDSTRRLWSHIMEPVAAGLRRLLPAETSCAPEVTLIPAGLLALLPLHAAWTDDVSTPTRRRYFLDEFTVRYAPSALALGHAHGAAGRVAGERLLAVEEPLAASATRLPNAHAEITAIADLFDDPVILTGAQATRQAVLAALGQAEVAHFSCHGSNDWQNPLASGLLMSDDKSNKGVLLTVGDLLETSQAGGRLATLAACETGIVGTNLPDEVVMLPSALLQAGFAGVAASLWSVPDISTAMLMEHFYRLWREDNEELTPAQALRAAQRWVRDSTNGEKAEYFKRYSPALSGSRMPEAVAIEFFTQAMSRHLDDRDFEHPHWWAAFYLTGV